MKRHYFKLVFRPATITEFKCVGAEDTDLYFCEEKRVRQGLGDYAHVQLGSSLSTSDSSHPVFAICEKYGLDPIGIAGMCLQTPNAKNGGEGTA